MLKWAPVVGWCWNFSDVIYLHRDWSKDKESITRGAKVHGDYPDPMILLIFAEGTRKNEEKLKASKEFAISRGIEPFKHHLVPRTKGFVHTIKTLDPSKVTAVYDVTMAVNEREGAVANLSSLLEGKTTVCEMYMRRYDTKELQSKSEKEIEDFLMDLYRDKDEMVENYSKTGSFTRNGQDSRFPDYPELEKPARWGSLINVGVLFYLVTLPVLRMFAQMLLSGSAWQAVAAASTAALLYAATKKLLDFTKTNKGSAYGSGAPASNKRD